MTATGGDSATASVQSVDRALTILGLLAAADGELGITDLANQLGVHKSTASRLVATLEAHELVEQQQDRGKYRLGLGLMRLSAAAALTVDLVRVARSAVNTLSAQTGETINVAILSGLSAFYVDQVGATSTLQSHNWVGQHIPLHATSNGKALLAFAPGEIVDAVCRAPLPGYTALTITSPERLRAEIAQVARQGWALAVDELEPGLTALAATIRGADGLTAGSISVSGPGFRLDGKLHTLAEQVHAAAENVSLRLGWRP
ncbi:MAG TPA: IclR family transcriptional regulator [Candidatus Lustribacter sp.]|nr:IclR family transcriptional regulator [Candidatus Lustribacter sp.]